MRSSLLLLLLLSGAVRAQTVVGGDELVHLARRIETAGANGDAQTVEALVNYPGLVERMLAGEFVFDADRREITRQMQRAGVFGRLFAEPAQAGGHVRFLREARRKGQPRARFRIVDATGRLTYVDVLVATDPAGTPRLVDAYPFTGSADLSVSLRYLLGAVLGRRRPGEAEPRPGAPPVDAFLDAFNAGDVEAAVALFPQLDVDLATRDALVPLFMQALAAGDQDRYTAALAAFERTFPDHPGLDLLQMDLYTLKGDQGALSKTLARLDAAVGGDAYLDLYRVAGWLAGGQADRALTALDRLALTEPDLDEVYSARLDVALDQGRPETVLREMQTLEDRFGWVFDAADLRQDPAWASFVSSPLFAVWLAGRSAK